MRIHLLCALVPLLMAATSMAQSHKLQLDKGNDAYREGDFQRASGHYDTALEGDGALDAARFNRANTMLRKSAMMAEEAQQNQDPAQQQAAMEKAAALSRKAASDFESLAKMAEEVGDRNRALYNQGNAHLLSGDLEAGIKAYKDALRIKPDDEEARYNLAYAMRMKQEQQKQEQKKEQDQEKQEQDEEKKDQKEQDKDQEQEQNQEQQQPDEPDQMSKEDAEKLLEAMMQQEKDLQEEVNKRKRKPQAINIEKDW